MKKYRITKITVKTREIFSTAKSSTGENSFAVCPVCNTTLGESVSTAEKNAEENQISKTRLKN